MKHYLLSLLLLPSLLYAQDSLYHTFPLKDGKITYEMVIPADSLNKTELYNKAKSWALTYFAAQKDALQTDDVNSGLLVYKTFFNVSHTAPKVGGVSPVYNWQIWATYKILFKEGKAKMIVSDVALQSANMTTPLPAEAYLKSFDQAPHIPLVLSKKKSERMLDDIRDNGIETFKQAQTKIFIAMSSFNQYIKSGGVADF